MNQSEIDSDSDVESIVVVAEGSSCYQDDEGRVFYNSLVCNGQPILRHDTISITLETDSESALSLGYGQVLSIYSHENQLMIECRWFDKPDEIKLPGSIRKKIVFESNELVETDNVDDISAGAFESLIRVNYPKKSSSTGKRKRSNSQVIQTAETDSRSIPNEDEEVVDDGDPGELCRFVMPGDDFICKYLQRQMTKNMESVDQQQRKARNSAFSKYSVAYSSVGDELSATSPSIFSLAYRRLALSAIPPILPCREAESDTVKQYIRQAIADHGNKKPLYLSGLPGTGKTATVLTAIAALKKEMRAGTIGKFRFLELNCCKLLRPHDAYTALWRFISGSFCSQTKALLSLNAYFGDRRRLAHPSDGEREPLLVVLLDEIDFLFTKDQNVIYNFLQWPLSQTGLTMLCVANINDLPDRLSDRVKSRLGGNFLQRMVYQPYHWQQIREILRERLRSVRLDAFPENALEVCARKAAVITGDIRSGLAICRRVIELHELKFAEEIAAAQRGERSMPVITIQTVIEAATEFRQNPLTAMLQIAPKVDKVILLATVKYCKSVREGPTSIRDIFEQIAMWHPSERELSLQIVKRATPLNGIPPYNTLVGAIERMIMHGVLSFHDEARSKNYSFEMRKVVTAIGHSDIIEALKESDLDLLQFI